MRALVLTASIVALAGASIVFGQARGQTATQIIASARDSVVQIRVRSNSDFAADPRPECRGPIGSNGTGFLLDLPGLADRYIVTNHHVAYDCFHPNRPIDLFIDFVSPITGRTTYRAAFVGGDEYSDLAVVKIPRFAGEPRGLRFPVAVLAETEEERSQHRLLHFHANAERVWGPRSGDDVIVIGFPGPLTGPATATFGNVSEPNRSISGETLAGIIQHTAAINLGNSGGPLLNLKGQVVGVNTWTIGTKQGFHFSTHYRIVIPAIAQLIRNGRVVRGELKGVELINLRSDVRARLETEGIVLEKKFSEAGLLVGHVAADSPAFGKLQPCDLITIFTASGLHGGDVDNIGAFRNTLLHLGRSVSSVNLGIRRFGMAKCEAFLEKATEAETREFRRRHGASMGEYLTVTVPLTFPN